MSSAARKAALRAGAKGARGRDRTRARLEAHERLIALPELSSARVVALYQAIGDEVPVEGCARLLRERGAEVAYPVVVGPALELAADPALPARVLASRVDVFIVPGLLFDRARRRLGRGGGHYDRLLAGKRGDALLVGICYSDRVVDELPEDPWDVPMDVVVTDQFVLRAR